MTVTRSASVEAAPVTPPPLSSYAQAYWRRVRGGEMGSLPAMLGIVALVVGFTLAKPIFLSERNFANLLSQSAIYIVVAMGLVFVLLLGEIDLSAGYTAGVSAAVMASILTDLHLDWYVAIPAGVLTGTLIGVVLGSLVAKMGIPSFVVTLSAFLAFQGVLLWLVKEGQIISVREFPVVLAISNTNLPVWLGWAFFAAAVGGFAAVQLIRTSRRASRGVSHDPYSLVMLRIGLVAVLGGLAVYVLNVNRGIGTTIQRGVPTVVPIVVVLLVLLTFVLKRTRYGLHLYAVGGSSEAARRAGIPIDRMRISAFMICSTLAAIGGIILSSRDNSVSGTTGGANLLLYAVGAAVIGGTSLFGGRGRMIDAVLGGLVVAIIENGMGLLGAKSWVKFVVTGLVLLIAAGVDALARRRSTAVGLR